MCSEQTLPLWKITQGDNTYVYLIKVNLKAADYFNLFIYSF